MPGDRTVNGHGVRAYASYEQGMAATIKTLPPAAYAGVRAALRRGDSARAVANAVVASPWGTTGLMLQTIPGAPRPTSTPTRRSPSEKPTANAAVPKPGPAGARAHGGPGRLAGRGLAARRRRPGRAGGPGDDPRPHRRSTVRGSADRADTLVATLQPGGQPRHRRAGERRPAGGRPSIPGGPRSPSTSAGPRRTCGRDPRRSPTSSATSPGRPT